MLFGCTPLGRFLAAKITFLSLIKFVLMEDSMPWSVRMPFDSFSTWSFEISVGVDVTLAVLRRLAAKICFVCRLAISLIVLAIFVRRDVGLLVLFGLVLNMCFVWFFFDSKEE